MSARAPRAMSAAAVPRRPGLPAVGGLALVGIVVVIAYAPAWSAPFIFDDLATIPQNPHIRSLWPPAEALSAPAQTGLAGRPIPSLSFAFNYALGGLDVRGFRAVNLALHGVAMLLVFGVVRRTLHTPRLVERYADRADLLALMVAALWALHPLHTESVIYLLQRTELLMAVCYLLTVYAALRAATGRRARAWSVVAVVACITGMASKEVMVSAPLLVVLYDRVFLYTTWRAGWRRRWPLYAGLAASWIVLLGLLASGPRSASIGFDHGIGASSYLYTQAGVLVHYLRLAVWPHPLVLSYDDWPIAASLRAVLLPGLVVVGLLAATAWALARRPAVGFLGILFFFVLAPTTSIVPIVTEVAAERRMYLPLAAVVIGLVFGGHALLARRRMVLLGGLAAVLAVVLAGVTWSRAQDYRSEIAIWQDTVRERPGNALAHINLANALYRADRLVEALSHYERALVLAPRDAKAQYNYANALAAVGRAEEALPHYDAALGLRPDDADIYYNLGIAYGQLDRTDDEIAAYQRAVALRPRHVGALNNMGLAYARLGDHVRAVAAHREALRTDPGSTVLRANLANALLDADAYPEAEALYRDVLRQEPEDLGARFHLAIALAMQDRRAEAVIELRAVLRRTPDHAGARRMLADLEASP